VRSASGEWRWIETYATPRMGPHGEFHGYVGVSPDVIAKVSRGLGEAMVGINVEDVPEPHRLAERGW
jgi:hypothetical protein